MSDYRPSCDLCGSTRSVDPGCGLCGSCCYDVNGTACPGLDR